jgi:hypothetical protein
MGGDLLHTMPRTAKERASVKEVHHIKSMLEVAVMECAVMMGPVEIATSGAVHEGDCPSTPAWSEHLLGHHRAARNFASHRELADEI